MVAPTQSPRRRLRVMVRGRVQGVFFRAWTQDLASGLELAGWVRNTPDGAVEILAEGPESHLQEMLRHCRQGPPGARVTAVEMQWEESESDLRGFHIHR